MSHFISSITLWSRCYYFLIFHPSSPSHPKKKTEGKRTLVDKEGWTRKNWCFWIEQLEKTLESPLDRREIKPVNSKGNQSWIFIGRTGWSCSILTTWCEEPTHWKRPWCWERLRARGEGGDREWDGWVASLTQWTWVWANSGRLWRTGKSGMLQSMGSQSQTWLSNWTATTAVYWGSQRVRSSGDADHRR